MHIVYFFTYEYSLKSWRDAGVYNRETALYKRFVNSGHKVTFITYGNDKDFDQLNSEDKFNLIPIYSLIKKSNFKLTNYIKSFIVPFYLYKKLGNFDVIKQNQLLGSWIPIILKLISKKPLYIRTGYDMYRFAKYENKSYFKQFLYYLLTKYTFRFADIYSVSSKADFDFLGKKFKKFNAKIVVRSNWVNKSKINQHETRKNKILMVGRLVSQKNYFAAIDLLKNSNIELDIIGEGKLKSEITKYASDNNVSITLLGMFDNEELINIYKQYKIYLSTSLYEGNSKSILEAMGAGCIVFANDIPNNQELIKEDRGFLLDFNTIKNREFISIVEKFLNSDETFDKFSSNAQIYIEKYHNLDILYKLTSQDFNLILNTNN